MSHPPRSPGRSGPGAPLELLTALGFGPDTVLMNDPKLFVDHRFLASLLAELHGELGESEASLALLQIGLLHGLRDAARLGRIHAATPSRPEDPVVRETTSVVLDLTGGIDLDRDGGIALAGTWPEQHEALARCSRLGAAASPACWMSTGYTSGWFSGLFDRKLLAREVECAAAGGERCRFEVREASAWIATGNAQMVRILSLVPFDAFRRVALAPSDGTERSTTPDATVEGGFDRSQPVVHIWGPVLVLPFTTLDEALGTVEMLGRDPGIREIRAVVIDLREQALDEGFGAAALEQVLESIETWSALSLITGVSPANESALASLEASHLVLRKDLPEAIATAFQIADAQRFSL